MKVSPLSAIKLAPSAARSLSSHSPALARAAATEPFPSTSAPTPYHPHVHLPLLSFAPTPTPRPERLVVPLPSPLFNTPSRPSLLHKLVVAHLASLRAGNAATKNRSQVNYSGKKLRPQKGTGGARLGSRGSPMLRGGGNAFALTPKGPDGWKRKVNRKEEQLGLRVSLSDKWRSGDLAVVDNIGLDEISTRVLRERLATRGWTDALFVLAPGTTADKDAFVRSCGNLADVRVVEDVDELAVWDVVKSRKVIIELDALDGVVARLDPEGRLVNEEDFESDLSEFDEAELAHELEEAMTLEAELEAKA